MFTCQTLPFLDSFRWSNGSRLTLKANFANSLQLDKRRIPSGHSCSNKDCFELAASCVAKAHSFPLKAESMGIPDFLKDRAAAACECKRL